jgi:hypothetical protein
MSGISTAPGRSDGQQLGSSIDATPITIQGHYIIKYGFYLVGAASSREYCSNHQLQFDFMVMSDKKRPHELLE